MLKKGRGEATPVGNGAFREAKAVSKKWDLFRGCKDACLFGEIVCD